MGSDRLRGPAMANSDGGKMSVGTESCGYPSRYVSFDISRR